MSHLFSCDRNFVKEVTYVIYQCILGRRFDLCTCADFTGKNKIDAGQDHGADRMPWRCIKVFMSRLRNMRAQEPVSHCLVLGMC